MARFVLVHGAFRGAWIWGPLAERLEAAGHTVEAPDLPACGEDPTPVEEVDLDAYADRICEVLRESLEPAILVGNSMGGVVVSEAAARCPEMVARLVYVAAFMPRDGQSLIDLTGLPEGADDQVQANVVVSGEPPVATLPKATSRVLSGECSDEMATWVAEKMQPQPLRPFTQPVSLGEEVERIPRTCVITTRDRAIPPPLQRRMVRERPVSDVVELEADHYPQLSRTEELAQALLERTEPGAPA
jgi:pimeloyl-ACP methyl ester carboxylesterase